MQLLSRSALAPLLLASLALVGCRSQAHSTVAPGVMEASVPARTLTSEPGAEAYASGSLDPYLVGLREPLPAASSAQRGGTKWRDGQALLQGYLGVNSIQDLSRRGGTSSDIEAGSGTISQYPVIGGGGQFKLGGNRVDLGLEAMMSLGGRANGGAFVVGGGGAAVAVSLDLLIVDFYGGPFVSVPLGERARLYGAAGPVVQFANYHQSAAPGVEAGTGGGFGVGGYARTGIELEISPGSFVGVGARWYDTSVNLSSNFGDLDIEGIEAMLTFSTRH